MKEIIKAIQQNHIDYDNIEYNVVTNRYPKNCHIHVIIPVRGRVEFMKPVLDGLYAAHRHDVDVSITVVEHSFKPEFKWITSEYAINYMYMPCGEKTPFNKCLCMNMGALFLDKSRFLLFHDSDLVVNEDFFTDILQNMFGQSVFAVQTFADRRVLHCDKRVTKELIEGKLTAKSLFKGAEGVYEKKRTGDAPGGSIMLYRTLFFKIGGYDPELFHSYSPEDLFFWDKMNLYTDVGVCNSPRNEVYHLDHPPQQNNNPDFGKMTKLYKRWAALPENDKKRICEYKAGLIHKYL